MSEKSTRSGLRPPSTSSLRPPQINTKVGVGATKRTLSTTSSTENLAKRPKPLTSNAGTASKSSASSGYGMRPPAAKGAATSKFPHIANYTGRPSTIATNIVSGRTRTGMGITRPAMSDRTNSQRKLSDETTNGKPKVKKPPAWDIKARLELMEQKERENCERIQKLESVNQNLNTVVQEKETVVVQNLKETEDLTAKVTQLGDENRDLKKRMEQAENDFNDQLRSKSRTIEDLEYTKSTSERRMKSLEDELSSKIAEIAGLKTTVAELTSSSAGIEARLKTSENSLKDAKEKINQLESLTASQSDRIIVYQEKQTAYETERRKLHNTILELKGNIRVFCRVRPLLPDKDANKSGSSSFDFNIPHIAFTGDKTMDIVRSADSPGSTSTSVSGKSEKFSFEFDHVFTDQASQESVFEEVSQLVQSSIDGYNVCIFAYGQTGSGKTYTMEGMDDEDDKRGIISRTSSKIFEETSSLVEKGWKYKIVANFVEIYNEEIRDLLATEKGLKHEIKRVDAKSNDIYVTNLKTEDVTNGHNIDQILRRAKKSRATAATNCNERSSRSHSVFILKIQGSNEKTGETCNGSLNLVDLAGSERLKDSGATGQRLEETKNINASLSNLSKVIMALANHKDGHIPYRDSKLTHLLMNSLGGNSKTLMFVNLSPKEESFNESLNSLRFAKRVNQCQIGTASKKT